MLLRRSSSRDTERHQEVLRCCRLVSRPLDGLPRKILCGQVFLGERLNIRREHPDLTVVDAAAPRRHSIRTPLVDRFEDCAGRSAEMPPAIGKCGSHRTRSISAVTIDAVVRDV